MAAADALRQLPSVDRVAADLARLTERFPRALVIEEIRRAVEEMRAEIHAHGEPLPPTAAERAAAALEAIERPSLRRVINATGVILHTNLGRAPLADFAPAAGYSNLEYDLEAGRRGKRDVHAAALLERLLGSPAIVVNNNASAVYLVLNELAAGGEVIVSRGQLIEIGDGFRIPDIMVRAGVVLREVGTTNRTRIEDYRDAITDRTRLVLLVHPSNFRIEGFAAQPERRVVAELARERNLPLYEDLGSGCLVDLKPFGVSEPLAADSLADGVSLISFSGDKLLGGPQCGVIAGDAALVARIRRNPMFRALRVDKLIYGALETTLRHLVLERWDAIPALRMIRLPLETIRARAEALAARVPRLRPEIVAGESVIGGGSTPQQPIRTWLVALKGDAAKRERSLRRHDPPVLARIEGDRLLLDLRTVFPEEDSVVAAALGLLA